MENVPRVFQYRLFKEILREIEKRYWIWTGVLNAALFGVPQTRHRAIVIGYRRDLCVAPSAPRPTHLGRRPVFDYSSKRFLSPATRDGSRVLGLCPDVGRADDYWMEHILALTDDTRCTEDLVVVREAIGDLPPASGDDGPLSYQEGASLYAQSLRDSEVRNHRRWGHSNRLLSRLRRIPEGGGLFDSRPRRSRQQPYYSQAYTRLHGDGLARTVTTNFHNPGSGRFLHYADLRTITVREAARLQGIRDDFVFIKSPTTQERLIGNAFPIPLAEALARHIATELTDKL